jgi:hypothetical protein
MVGAGRIVPALGLPMPVIHVESKSTADCRSPEPDPGKERPLEADPGGLVITHIFEPRKVQALDGDPARGAGPVSSAVSSAPL